jgi:hypothetical protein
LENYPNQVGPVSSHQPDLAFPSYTLFAPHGSTFILLIDMDGQTAHYWTIPSQLGSGIELLSNGNLVFSVETGEEPTHFLDTVGGRLIEMNPKGEIVWQFVNPYTFEISRYGATNLVYKAAKYGYGHPGIKNLGL